MSTRDAERDARLSRTGRGKTKNPRVYVGCLPCGQGHHTADLDHANRWIETHWRRCPRSDTLSPGL